tara:strand:- start:78 stop:635 length:558 start_codon:yes stop_codon:yes gene_type:complete
MAILRAGPFSDGTDFHLNEPSPADYNIYPVNAALDYSSLTWTWRYRRTILTLQTGEPVFGPVTYVDEAVDESESFSSVGRKSIISTFTYQASNSMVMSGSYDIEQTRTNPINLAETRFVVYVGTFSAGGLEFSDSDTSTSFSSISGNFSVDLPASVLPNLVVIGGTAGRGVSTIQGDSSIQYSLS